MSQTIANITYLAFNLTFVRMISLIVITMVSACSILPEAPPPRRLFDLGTVAEVPVYKQLPVNISIAKPSALKVSNGDGLLIRRASDNELSFLPKAALPDRLINIVQARFIEGMANSNGFLSVSSNQGRSRETVNVSIRIFVFEVVEDQGELSAQVRMKFDLFDRRFKSIIATKVFSTSATVDKVEPNSIAAGLGKALNTVEEKAIRWIYRNSKAYLAKRAEDKKTKDEGN